MDKEKQIEELANKLYSKQDEYDLTNPFEVAKAVINLGYRKINDNEVVISKEEYETKKEIVANWGFLQQEIMQGKFVAIADLEKDGKVIISKEEYENVWKKGYEEGYSILVDDTIKKTAKKFEKMFIINLLNNSVVEDYKLEELEFDGEEIREALNDCLKQFGVEIGEEK